MTLATHCGSPHGGYRHEALFYGSHDEFMEATLGFIRESVAATEPILIVLNAKKIDSLRGELRLELSERSESLLFADMAEVGSNPARIIPAWQAFVAKYSGKGARLRGIGEPIWAGRSPAELAECQRHEALLNAAFDNPDFWLLCPYDIKALPEPVLAEAMRNHPHVRAGNVSTLSSRFPGVGALVSPFDAPLSPAPMNATVLNFRKDTLREVRAFVTDFARATGMSAEPTTDLVLAAHEIAVNAIAYGSDDATLLLWQVHDTVLCEVRSSGTIASDPLLDRRHPRAGLDRGRGLWIANQLCDLVQLRSFPGEVVVRLHFRVR